MKLNLEESQLYQDSFQIVRFKAVPGTPRVLLHQLWNQQCLMIHQLPAQGRGLSTSPSHRSLRASHRYMRLL
ncbi:hypothetical protein DPMN_183917 [Dreissena polymorpha]|uniref:Uncharacterized protein n=1 Tax=Dreissena polymorpha TaxID=45954 RepID=A0A9D4DKS1_DREPO|nr:hypothetical protein DPMN_183917 [Dreissena polymorpha]